MNTRPASAAALEKALADKLRALLQGISWLPEVQVQPNPTELGRTFDLLASFQVPKGPEIQLWVDCRAEPRPAQFPYVALERDFEQKAVRRVRVWVFAAPHISPRMAEICESHGWSWFDLAGNCRISVPGLLHLEHRGNAPVHGRPRPKANLGTKEAARVVRALLSSELLSRPIWTQRYLRSRCEPDVSLGLVNKVVQHLRDEKILAGSTDRGFQVRDPLALLVAWRDAYRLHQHEQLGYFTLLNGWALLEALSEVHAASKGKLLYAAFSAASIQAPNVRQPKTWLYIKEAELPVFEKIVDARPVDTGSNLVVLVPRDDGVFAFSDGGVIEDYPIACTNLVQTYVDLWHCGGRGQEAAEAVLEQRLKPAWRALGH